MIFPAEVQEILDVATTGVANDLQHRLSPLTRSRIYKTLRMVYGSPVPNLLFGHLGYLTSQKVRHYWDDAMPLWPDDEGEPEPKTRHLTSYFLKLLQQVLDGNADLDFVTQELGTYWYVTSNIGDEIF